MKTETHFLRCVVLALCLSACAVIASGQDSVSNQSGKLPDKVLAFLNPGGEMRKYKATFAGEVVSIPEDMRKSLELQFYLHRFTIVRMKRSRDISYVNSELIVVTDAKGGDVVTYLWELGMRSAPASFKQLLTQYPPDEWRGVAARIKLLGDLLVYPDMDYERFIGSRVGSIRLNEKEKIISAELIRSYVPYCLMQLHVEAVGDRYKFGRLILLNPETGKEI